ncbi:tetratricopeptide repeat protein [Rhodocaloribacter litoris]|nr:tetratricopeptide repeat protein [Rhodocaloribacter litoris]
MCTPSRSVNQLQGDYAAAESLHTASIALHRAAPDPDREEFAASLNNLALVYTNFGKYEAADSLYQRGAGRARPTVWGGASPYRHDPPEQSHPAEAVRKHGGVRSAVPRSPGDAHRTAGGGPPGGGTEPQPPCRSAHPDRAVPRGRVASAGRPRPL